jgi:ketosteroid isomerase-like protein
MPRWRRRCASGLARGDQGPTASSRATTAASATKFSSGAPNTGSAGKAGSRFGERRSNCGTCATAKPSDVRCSIEKPTLSKRPGHGSRNVAGELMTLAASPTTHEIGRGHSAPGGHLRGAEGARSARALRRCRHFMRRRLQFLSRTWRSCAMPSAPSVNGGWRLWPTSGPLTSTGGQSKVRPMMWARCKELRRCVTTSKTGSTRSTTSATCRRSFSTLAMIAFLAVQRATGRAKASGVETELRYAVVYTLRDRKIARGREYIDRATDRRRRAAGVGDVAGERGDRATHLLAWSGRRWGLCGASTTTLSASSSIGIPNSDRRPPIQAAC